jgi:hypothetical protein
MCDLTEECNDYHGTKDCDDFDNISEGKPICFNPLKTNKEPVADVLCNVGLCGKWDNFGKLRLIHDDFAHDMMITLSGDFTDEKLADG